MSTFKPLLNPTKERPRSVWTQAHSRKGFIWSMLKDQFNFSSILAIGATLNFLLYLAIGSKAFILAPLLLIVRLIDTLLQTYGITKNPYMENVINGVKMSAQFPQEDGSFSGKPADGQVVVFMIGARCNHPLGLLGPGYKELGDYFDKMLADLEQRGDEYGFLGAQHWRAEGQRSTGNETMAVMYFRTPEGLHDYAHGPLHREGWNWWRQTEKDHNYLGIWHEIWVSPKNHWETVYVNSEPMLFGSATFRAKTSAGTLWQNPLVESKGLLRTSKGRMTLTDGSDYEKYGDDDPYSVRV